MLWTTSVRNCGKMTYLVGQCAYAFHHVNYCNFMRRSSPLLGRILQLHNVDHNSMNQSQSQNESSASWISHRQFTMSAYYSAKNVRRIIRKPVRVNKKAMKLEVVDIRPGMTMKQLSVVLKRSVDQIDEALGFIPGTDLIIGKDQEIKDIAILKEVVRICGFRHKIVSRLKDEIPVADKDEYPRPPADPAQLVRRPPVVTVMGHVDHGKTTLLDSLRKTRVVDQEFGGITQHIGAFRVKLPGTSQTITFLDTPGHAAFSAMRGRGARVTDMVILVVAAEDGVMDQTAESIEHARAAGVPIIVAINKIDKASPSQIDVCKRELLEHGIQLEEFGGDIQAVPISALKGTNLLKLQECVLVQAELADLTADVDGMVEASVIEARTDPGKGKVATVLVQRGTLKKGDLLVAGKVMAKVRAMFDDGGKAVGKASPSHAVEVLGWKELPSCGEQILQVKTEQRAREVIDWRIAKDKERKALSEREVIDAKMDEHRRLHTLAMEERRAKGIRRVRDKQKVKETVTNRDGPQLSIVLKGDVDGSVEALLDTFETYDNNSCYLDLIHFGVGQVTETDVEHAAPFSGIVYGFNVIIPTSVRDFAEKCGVSVRSYNVIYRLIEDLRRELTSRLPPIEKEEVQGEAEVKQIFTVKEGKQKLDVAGSKCIKGTLSKSGLYRVYRDGELLFEGTARSLRHFKNEVDTVKMNVECGLLLSDTDFKLAPGDVLHCVSSVQVEQELKWEPQGFTL